MTSTETDYAINTKAKVLPICVSAHNSLKPENNYNYSKYIKYYYQNY